jgi:hypothetical protein
MNKRAIWISAAGGFVALFLLFYGLSPFLAAGPLVTALKTGDRDKLEQLIDFPSVREHLKEDLRARLMHKLQSDLGVKHSPFAGLGMLIGPAIVDRMVDNLITPATISTVVQNGRQAKSYGISGGSGGSGGGGGEHKLSKPTYAYDGLNRFRISFRSEDGSVFAFVMTRKALFGWRVTRIVIPAEVFKDRDETSRQDRSPVAVLASALR